MYASYREGLLIYIAVCFVDADWGAAMIGGGGEGGRGREEGEVHFKR